MRHRLKPVHPGEILRKEFLRPLKITPTRLAHDLSVPRQRVLEIIQGDRPVCADTALRLARFFGTSDRFWLNLQAHYDLEMAKQTLGRRLRDEVKVSRRRVASTV